MSTRVPTIALLALTWLALAHCGGSTPPTAPSPPAQPAPGDPPPGIASMAGRWIGTLESTNFASRVISMEIFQTADCVDGGWESQPAEWAGALSGLADVGSFEGIVSLERMSAGTRCSGIAMVSGDVRRDTITLTGAGFSGNCPGGMPQAVAIVLRRQP
jgi:hypothetical protein